MKEETQRLPVLEKIGYSLGDAGANFVFKTMIMFQLFFYTNTMGILAWQAGTLLLVARLWDAFFDPMMGVIADRTNTRWGKFRPWVLWSAIPWGIVMVLAYTTPDFSSAGTIVYAFVTNILLMTLYSVNNTPYSAMTGVMTGNVNERTSLSSYRFVSAMIAQLMVAGLTLPLVAKFGKGNDAKGWQMTIGLWAVLCIILFTITFLTTRERIQPDPKQKSSVKEDFGNLLKNKPWIVMFFVTLCQFIVEALRGGTLVYYFKHYISQDSMFDVLQTLGLTSDGGSGWWHGLLNSFGLIINAEKTNVADVGYSLFSMSSQFVTVIGVLCATYLGIRFGKKAVALAGFALAGIFMAMFMLLSSDSIGATFALEYLRAISFAPAIPLLWAMFADVADYAEWKTGRRTTGVIYATIMFSLKAGLSLGGAIAGWLLSAYGYVPNVEQTTKALLGIRLTISVYPAIFYAIIIWCLVFYQIGKKLNIQIQDELAERRKQFQN
ncbi:MAG: MFS transporter [Acidobacteria bacterium]|nr:MFS transporter [Acidobacteriota bacterium]